jgi:outer membrane protein TolC
MRSGWQRCILIAIIQCWATAAAAAPLSLQDCVIYAIAYSPTLAAARHELKAAAENQTEKQRALLPFLGAQTSAYEVNGSAATPFSALRVFTPENPSNRAHWGPVGIESIGATYPLIQDGSILGLNNPPSVAASRALVEQQLAKILLAEQKVIFDTVTDYLYAAAYRQEVPMTSSILRLSPEKLEIIQYQVQLGIKLPQDAELARAELAAAQAAQASTLLNAHNSMSALGRLLGRKDGDIAIEIAQPTTPQLPALDEILAHVMPIHPALKVQQGQVEIAQQQLRIDKAALFPSVRLNTDFTGAQSLEHFSGGTLSNFLSFIQVDIPIFDFGQRRATVRKSKQIVAAQQDSLNGLDLELRDSISRTYSEIMDANQQVTALQDNVLAARNAALLADARRDQGLADELAVVEARLNMQVARIKLEHEQLTMQLKYVELQNLSGGLWSWVK